MYPGATLEPPANRNAYSKEAAASMRPVTGTLRQQVFDLIAAHGPVATFQLEDLTGRSHQSVSARVNELEKTLFDIVAIGSRQAPSGRWAAMFVAAKPPEEVRSMAYKLQWPREQWAPQVLRGERKTDLPFTVLHRHDIEHVALCGAEVGDPLPRGHKVDPESRVAICMREGCRPAIVEGQG